MSASTQNIPPRLQSAIDRLIASGVSTERAFAKACKENPELHQQWIGAHTAEHVTKVRRGLRR